jgi:hypothetical protein
MFGRSTLQTVIDRPVVWGISQFREVYRNVLNFDFFQLRIILLFYSGKTFYSKPRNSLPESMYWYTMCCALVPNFYDFFTRFFFCIALFPAESLRACACMTYSIDLLWRVVFLWYYDEKRPHQICETLRLSLSTVKRVLQRLTICHSSKNRRKQPTDKKLNMESLAPSSTLKGTKRLCISMRCETPCVERQAPTCKALREHLR